VSFKETCSFLETYRTFERRLRVTRVTGQSVFRSDPPMAAGKRADSPVNHDWFWDDSLFPSR
jgi:hypothetical protein